MIVGSWLGLEVDEVTQDQVFDLEEALTFKVRQYMPEAGENDEPRVIHAFKPGDGEVKIWIPAMALEHPKIQKIVSNQSLSSWINGANGWAKYRGHGYPVLNVVDEDRLGYGPEFSLRDYQLDLVQNFLGAYEFRLGMGGILESPPGTGKTVMGAEIVRHCGVKAIVAVHKEFLMNQWSNAFKLVAPDMKVMKIGGKNIFPADWRQKDVCIVMIQSLLSDKFRSKLPKEFFNAYSLSIYDEVHRYGSAKWQEIMGMFLTKRVGLTATPRRSDGCTDLIKMHVGPIIAWGDGVLLSPVVKRVFFKGTYSLKKWMFDQNGKLKMPMLEKQIVNREDRNEVLVRQIVEATKAGRQIIVLSSRRNHLEELKKWCEKELYGWKDGSGYVPKFGFYVGGMKKAEYREVENDVDVIFATWTMASEGLDIPRLDVLVMATPRSGVEQAVGRILRRVKRRKPDPIVVDVIDTEVVDLVTMFESRRRIYKKLGTEVESIT